MIFNTLLLFFRYFYMISFGLLVIRMSVNTFHQVNFIAHLKWNHFLLTEMFDNDSNV